MGMTVASIFTMFSATISVSAAEINSETVSAITDNSDEVDLSEFGAVITDDDMGYIVSSNGLITKSTLEKQLSEQSSRAVGAGSKVTIHYCYDTAGNPIKAIKNIMTHHTGEIQCRFVINSTGENAYCIQPGTMLNEYSTVTENASDAWKNLTKGQQEAINVALCYGANGNASVITNGTTINSDQLYVATQLIIWEIVKGERSAVAPYSLKNGKSGYLSMYCDGSKNPNIEKAYHRIVSAMSTYAKIPTFSNRNKANIPTYTINCSYNQTSKVWTYGSATLTDNNKVLSQFKNMAGTFTVNTGSYQVTVKAVVEGNQLKLTTSNGKLSSAKATSALLSADKTGIPKSKQGSLIAYGSSYVQDTVTGGHIDPPSAYLNVKVNVDTTGKLNRDGRIRKVIQTENEFDDNSIDEDEGSFSTAENLSGWYFEVEAPTKFKETYGVSKFVLGPTDELGYTEYLSEYITKHFGSKATEIVPFGDYYFKELGKKNSLGIYYIPGQYDKSYITDSTGCIRFSDNDNTKYSLSQVGYFYNIIRIPVQIFKQCEDMSVLPTGKANRYYFELKNNNTGIIYTICTNNEKGQCRVYSSSDGTTASSINGTITDDNGVLREVMYLPEGEYTMHELGQADESSSTGYSIPSRYDTPDDITFSVNAEEWKKAQQSNPDSPYIAITQYFTNTVSSYIALKKSDSVTGKAVANATYGIFSGNTTDENGVILDTLLIDYLTTDKNGYAQTESKWSNGTYYLQELVDGVPSGYLWNSKIYEVVIDAPETKGETILVEAEDKPCKGKIELTKIDEETSKVLSGAVYGIYKYNTVDKDGNLLNAFKLDTLTTDSNGKATSIEFDNGTYYMQEITPPSCYVRDKTVYPVIINADSENFVVKVTRTDKPTSTEISKTDITGQNELPGAKLKVTDCNGKVVEEWISGSTPHIIKGLPAGEYILTEEIAPDGFVTATSIEFTVKDDGTVNKVVMKDDTTKYEFTKVDENNKLIKGVTLQVLDSTKTKVIEEWITDGKTNHQIIGKLVVGNTYYLHEVNAPNQFQIAADIKFTVKDTAQLQTVKMIDKLKKGSVTLYKQDENGDALAGSEWALFKADGTAVPVMQNGNGRYLASSTGKVIDLSTDTNGKLFVNELELGDYYFVETKSPKGRMPYGQKLKFTISAESEVTLYPTVTAKNDKVVLYETGYQGNNTIYFAGLTGLVISLSVIAIYTLKTKKQHDRR